MRFNLSYDRIIPREVAFFMNKLTKLNASYIAGFLDGDGSIYVRLKPNETYRFGFQVAPNIVFYQSKKETKFLKRLEKMIGGGYIRFRNDGIAEYIIGDTKTMRDLIKRIKPYLVLKKAQANLLIQILNQKEKVRTKKDFLKLVRAIDLYKDLNYSKKRKIGLITVVNRFRKT